MLFDALLAAIVVALIGGGRLSRLGELRLRWPWVFVAALGLRAAVRIMGAAGWAAGPSAAPALHLASYALLLAAMAANWHLWPMGIAAIGVIANLTVIAANGGAMPVAAELVRRSGQLRLLSLVEAGRYPTHTLMGPDTRLPFLADRLFLPPPYPRPCVFSPGDILLTAGVVLLLVRGMGAFGWGRRPQGAPTTERPTCPAP